MNINMDKLREIAGIINRPKNVTGEDMRVLMELYSPPMKGNELQPKEYHYPEALSGLHGTGEKPRITVSGDTSGKLVSLT
jgi:hypothetical protein